MRTTLLAVALAITLPVLNAGPATAQQSLKVDFHDGLVTVDATSVPVRAILAEWAKVGGTKVVGAERIIGAPLTVKLVNVSEAQALETILRSAAGYMAAPRQVAGGPSRYDRILIMATTSTPAPAPAAVRQGNQPNPAFAGTQRFVPPRRQEQAEQPEIEEPDENPPSPPVFTFPPQQPGFNSQPGIGNNQPGMAATPNGGQSITVNPSTNGPQNITINPQPGQAPTQPIGVSTPGQMIMPPQPPNQPGVRPPGGERRQ